MSRKFDGDFHMPTRACFVLQGFVTFIMIATGHLLPAPNELAIYCPVVC